MSENFQDRLRKIRLERGLSQADLARRSGFQPSAISHFETGARSPSFDNLRRLADALGVSIDYLLGRQSQSTAAGPVADRLHRNFEKMSSSDQEAIADMAEQLAKRNTARDEDDGA